MDERKKPTFYSYANAVRISDEKINAWIEQCVKDVRRRKDAAAVRSGDTMVAAFWYHADVFLTVSTSDGYSSVHIEHDEEVPKYVRGAGNFR